jgi:hypothetical protein
MKTNVKLSLAKQLFNAKMGTERDYFTENSLNICSVSTQLCCVVRFLEFIREATFLKKLGRIPTVDKQNT